VAKDLTDALPAGAANAALPRSHAEAIKLEGEAGLAVVAGELGHDLVHTLNFLRCLIAEASESTPLAAEDIAIAQREAERLQRVLLRLRMLKLPPPAYEPVPVGPLLHAVKAELEHELTAKHLSLTFSFVEDAALIADRRLLHVLIRSVLSGLIRCASEQGRIGLCVTPCGLGSGSFVPRARSQ
jgi:hypothetical protein